jgi:hypothetical protein
VAKPVHPVPPFPRAKEKGETAMKTAITSILFAAAMTVSVASAQNIKVTIPFDFNADGRSMPAGHYLVRHIPGFTSAVYDLTQEASGHRTMLMTRVGIAAKHTAQPPRLVFDCVGSNCALSEIWPGENLDGHALWKKPTPRDAEVKHVAVLLTSGSAK